MNVATFLAKADALKSRSMLAVFSSDTKLLKREFEAAVDRYNADLNTRFAQGRPLPSCPPRDLTFEVGFKDLDEFRRIPAAQRSRTTITQAFASSMARRYPCPHGARP